MPQFDYDCETHGHFEDFARMADCEAPKACPHCGAESPRIFVASAPRDYVETLVAWKKPDGTYALPGQADARMPAEYERVEVRETYQKRAIEREINREEREKWERANIGKQMQRAEVERVNRSELRTIMQQGGYITGPDGGRKFIPPMSAKMRDFARFAMQQNDNRPREKFNKVFHFEALSMNSSNREPGRNRDGSRVRK
jgi:putative FmdB family regulatory protein